MGDDDSERSGAFPDGFVGPITGLLSVVFAVMAGASAAQVVPDVTVESVATPITFAAVSLLCLWLRAKYG